MTASPTNPPPLRIPILHGDKIVDELGMPTPAEWAFRQALTDSLQSYLGNEGLVAPTQTSAGITTIQNHTDPNTGAATCQRGTIIYNSTANSIMIAIDNGAGSPIFKTVTLT